MDSVLVSPKTPSNTDLPEFNKSLSNNSTDSGVDVRLVESTSVDVEAPAEDRDHENTVKHSCHSTSKTDSAATSFEGCREHDTHTHTQGEDSPDLPETVASEAMRPWYSELVSAIDQITVDQFASDLYSRSLVENGIMRDAQTPGVSNTYKASKLMNAVMDRIRLSHANEQPFHKFVQLLEQYQCCPKIVNEIMDKYEQLKQSQNDTSRSQGKKEEQNLLDSMPAQSQAKTVQPSSIKFGAPPTDTIHQHSKSGSKCSDELRKFRKKFAKVMRKSEQDALCVTVENLHRTEMKIEELQKGVEESRQKNNEAEKGVPEGQWRIGLSVPIILLVSFIILNNFGK